MESGSNKESDSAVPVPVLPDDPMVEILSYVPAKCVCRFKCVSRASRDLVADPNHRKKLPQPMQGLFVQTFTVAPFDFTQLASISFDFIDLMTVRSAPLDIDPSFSFLMERTGIKPFFLNSCNGLILFEHHHERSHTSVGTYTVCNPTTKQWLVVPACGSHEALSYTYLAFDPAISSHFHLVQFQTPKVGMRILSLHVYSSETGTWSQNRIDEQEEQGQLEGWHRQFKLEVIDRHCAFVKGFLHLIVWSLSVRHILVLDIQGRARKIITVPGMADGSQSRGNITHYLGQSQGHLHYVTIESADENNEKLFIWVLQDYDTQEWVLKRIVNSLDFFGETRDRLEYQVVDIHQDSNVLFIINRFTCELIAYDMDHQEVSVLATFQDYKSWGDFARYVPYYLESPALTNQH